MEWNYYVPASTVLVTIEQTRGKGSFNNPCSSQEPGLSYPSSTYFFDVSSLKCWVFSQKIKDEPFDYLTVLKFSCKELQAFIDHQQKDMRTSNGTVVSCCLHNPNLLFNAFIFDTLGTLSLR